MNKNRSFAFQHPTLKAFRFCLISLFLLFFSAICAKAQHAESSGKLIKDDPVSADYRRSSITYLLVETNTNSNNQRIKTAMSKLNIPDKFNDNNLVKRSFGVSRFERDTEMDFLSQALSRKIMPESSLSIISDALAEEKIANEVIAKWWSRKDDGTFGVELLQERGAYDATDAEVIAARAGVRGMTRVMDAGEELLNKSYILVFDFYNIKTMEQYYNDVDENRRETASKRETGFTPVDRTMEGYRTDLMAHLFRIDYNDSVSAVFYQELWINPDLDNKQTWDSKKKRFNDFDFPIEYITSVKTSQQSAQSKKASFGKKTDDQLFEKMVEQGIEEVLFQLSTKYEDFRVKTAVYATRPIRAKIGLKEGLSVDQRYFVYEYELNTTGEAVPVKKGVIRAKNNISDNRQVASGETKPSRFYQVAGSRIEQGMLLQQKNDFGVGVTIGYGIDNMVLGSGLWLMAEINMSQMLGRAGKQWSPGIKLYVDASFDGIDDDDLPLSILSITGGLSKDMFLMRNVHLTPFLGIGFESASANEDGTIYTNTVPVDLVSEEEILYTLFASAGVRLGINLRHNIQLLPSFNYQIGSYESYIISNEKLKDMDLVLPQDLLDRTGGLQTRLSLRIQL